MAHKSLDLFDQPRYGRISWETSAAQVILPSKRVPAGTFISARHIEFSCEGTKQSTVLEFSNAAQVDQEMYIVPEVFAIWIHHSLGHNNSVLFCSVGIVISARSPGPQKTRPPKKRAPSGQTWWRKFGAHRQAKHLVHSARGDHLRTWNSVPRQKLSQWILGAP